MALKNLFADYPGESMVWLYQSDRKMTEQEMKEIETNLLAFAESWNNHGEPLKGTVKVVNPYFIISTIDTEVYDVHGCSIDDFNSRLKDIAEHYKIDFFNRMIVTIEENGELKQVPFSEISNHKEALVYDPLASSLDEIRNHWPRPLKESNFAQVVA